MRQGIPAPHRPVVITARPRAYEEGIFRLGGVLRRDRAGLARPKSVIVALVVGDRDLVVDFRVLVVTIGGRRGAARAVPLDDHPRGHDAHRRYGRQEPPR